MKVILRNTLAVVLGFIAGSVVNMLLVNVGPHVVPLPEGSDVSTMEGLKESMKLFTPMNFLFPFLGHALGTLVGAFVAAKVGGGRLALALVVSVFFLAGGAMMVVTVGGPVWFCALDLIVAYLPMGYLGGRMAAPKTEEPAAPAE